MDVEKKIVEKLPEQVQVMYPIVKRKFHDNESGAITVGKIVILVIICYVVAYVLPGGLIALGAINTTGMPDGTSELIGAFGVIIVLIIFASLAKEAE